MDEEWISVNDRMPDPLNKYEVFRHLITDGLMVREANFVYWPPWTWVLPHQMKKVTHWMPLPKPPKEK